MKTILKTILILPLVVIPVPLKAPNWYVDIIAKESGYKPYEKVFDAVCWVESNDNALAYNEAEGSVGIAQIRAIKVDDYNKRTGKNIKHEDCFCPQISKEIFMHHMEQYGVYRIDDGVRAWNGSGASTYAYLEKVKARLLTN